MSAKLTIIQCVNNLDIGGVERMVLSLARRIKDRGYHSAICCIENCGTLADEAEQMGISVQALNMSKNGKLTTLRALCAFLRQRKPVVIHSHNFKPFYYSALATMLHASNGHIHTRHGALLHHQPVAWRYRLLRSGVDAWVTVSADRQSELAARTGLLPTAIHVLANGVDTEKFCPATDKPAIRRQLNLPVAAPAIMVAARLAPEKDLLTLLQAFRLVRQQLPLAELWLAGDGPERANLERATGELGLSTAVRFLGARDDIHRLLQATDVFALSSLSEGLSIALIEAAACGVPIVATAVGGNGEVVNPPNGGQLVPVGNPSAMATALISILSNSELSATMGRAARHHAEKNFGVMQMANAYFQLYHAALHRRGIQ